MEFGGLEAHLHDIAVIGHGEIGKLSQNALHAERAPVCRERIAEPYIRVSSVVIRPPLEINANIVLECGILNDAGLIDHVEFYDPVK